MVRHDEINWGPLLPLPPRAPSGAEPVSADRLVVEDLAREVALLREEKESYRALAVAAIEHLSKLVVKVDQLTASIRGRLGLSEDDPDE